MSSSSQGAPTYYDILGISRSADQKEIRRAYLKASLKHHPDKNPDDMEGAKLRFIEIGRAHDVLKDPTERAKYDRELMMGTLRGKRTQTKSHSGDSFEDEFSSYSDAFDSFVGGMSEEELNAAVGAAALVGGFIGSIIGSRLGQSKGGKQSASAFESLLSNAGSMAGSVVGSQLGSQLVENVHSRSVDRLTYEQRRKDAETRGASIPEKPKGIFDEVGNSFRNSINNFFGNDDHTMEYDATPRRSTSTRSHTSTRSMETNEEAWERKMKTAFKVIGAVSAFSAAAASASGSANNRRKR